jgi:hypothetical protein
MYGVLDEWPHSDTGAGGVRALDPQQLGVHFALVEAAGVLQHHVDQHLRVEGDLSYVQFQLLARFAAAHGQLTMTQLADGVVYSRTRHQPQRARLPHRTALVFSSTL